MRTLPVPEGEHAACRSDPVPFWPLSSFERCASHMSNGGQEHSSHPLFGEIERDFEALARLIERTIEHLIVDGATNVDIERLVRAKVSAECGASLAKKDSTGR